MGPLATLWTVTCQAPLSVEFSRPEYCSEFPFPSPGTLPNPEMEPESPALQANCLPCEPPFFFFPNPQLLLLDLVVVNFHGCIIHVDSFSLFINFGR